jgi:probable H4MPT-linked C1 transfer pathway protein
VEKQILNTLGLDIGGANIKAAHSDGRAWSQSFALWKNPDALVHELAALLLEVGHYDRLVVTTTAELCDCFAIKREGVNRVLDAVVQVAQNKPVYVWQTDGRFACIEQARENTPLCAAANWHALATYMAQAYPQGLSLMLDTGSTTTDVIKLDQSRVAAVGLTDRQRLATGELVYLGARRTPLMALGPQVVFRGRPHRVMAEHFATMADVNLLLGNLHEDEQDHDTADGRGMNKRWASARLCRMIGADLEIMSFDDVMELAQGFADIARQRIVEGLEQVLAGSTPDRIIISGSGDFMAQAAVDMALPGAKIVSWSQRIGPDASTAACAHAMVRLIDKGLVVPDSDAGSP